jgi:predicted nucleotidyltransferase component of viral defense system
VSGPYDVRLTQGHVLRHAPAQSPQGRDAAVIDIAQDLLLRHLSERGALTLVAFKGGTALRKVYAGAGGRFSTDLDFSVATLDDVPTTSSSSSDPR